MGGFLNGGPILKIFEIFEFGILCMFRNCLEFLAPFLDSPGFLGPNSPIWSPRNPLGAIFKPKQNFEKFAILTPHLENPPSALFRFVGHFGSQHRSRKGSEKELDFRAILLKEEKTVHLFWGIFRNFRKFSNFQKFRN